MASSSSSSSLSGGRDTLLAAAREELVEHGHAAISLRAVARRAGVSHAAPKHHFGDRAGLLTAIATEGFEGLAAALSDAGRRRSNRNRLAALGRAYVDFGLTHPALYDLMFRPTELHPDDPALQEAQARAIGALTATVARLVGASGDDPDEVTDLALISWALVHGLVVLGRDGVLQSAADLTGAAAVPVIEHHLAALFARRVFPDGTPVD